MPSDKYLKIINNAYKIVKVIKERCQRLIQDFSTHEQKQTNNITSKPVNV